MKTQAFRKPYRSSTNVWKPMVQTKTSFLKLLTILLICIAFITILLVVFYQYGFYQKGLSLVIKYEFRLPEHSGAIFEPKLESRIRNSGIKDEEILHVVRSLEEPTIDTDYSHVFKGDPSNKSTWEFDFSQISKRRFGRNYVEITSADTRGRNVDMFNPLYVSGRSMVLFEDFGPGILERMLLHRRKTEKGDIGYIVIEIDGMRLFMAADTDKNPKETFPFKEPLFRASLKSGTGYFVTFPIAYQSSIRVISEWIKGPEYEDAEIWNHTAKCKRDRTHCAIGCYFAISCNKLVHGTKLNTTFNDYFLQPDLDPKKVYLKDVANAVSEMANAPEVYGPGMKSGCQLTCQKVYSGKEVVIFAAENSAQVIQSILFRVYDVSGKAIMAKNWKTMLLTMRWDGKEHAQVHEIPLAGIFTNGFDYLREVRSLNAGVKMKTCHSRGHRVSEMEPHDWLAYLFYDMPFWKSARITIRRMPGLNPGIICTKITTKPLDMNQYNPRLTGYFSAQLNQQVFGISKHKTMMRLENEWGHVVAVNYFLRNTKVAYTQENDIIIEVDQANVPTISGTGMEDYFDYVHSFADYINTTSVFNGVPFFSKIKRLRWLRCYRHMLLDPVLFTTGILIYNEGYWDRIDRRVYRNFETISSKFNQTSKPDSLLSVVLYYGSKGNGGVTTDRVDYKDFKPGNASLNFQFSPSEVNRYSVNAMFENQPHFAFDRIVVSMKPQQTVTHTFKISKNNVGVILTREYRSLVPNQKAHVEIDGHYAGLWFCPQRSNHELYSLRLNDYHLPPRFTVGKDSIKVMLKAVTVWESVSIKVVSVVLTD